MEFKSMSKEILEETIEMGKELLQDDKLIKEKTRELFEQFDNNEDGFLQLDEFSKAMVDAYANLKISALALSQEEIKEKFMKADTNHDHKISKKEFIPVVKRILQLALHEAEITLESKWSAEGESV